MTEYRLLPAFVIVAIFTAPALAQHIVGDGPNGREVVVSVSAETTGTKKKSKKSQATEPAKPAEPQVPTFTATGGFESSKDKARDSAVRAAVEKLHEHLWQTEGVNRMPTPEQVRKMLLEDQEKVVEEPIVSEKGVTETMYRMTVAVKVESKHLRELRSRERSSEVLWILAGLAGIAAVIAGFFKIDAWTKGYLTSWLALGAVGAGALTLGMWWMAK